MSLPSREHRAPSSFCALALVSVLHTSVASTFAARTAQAQVQTQPQAPSASQTPPAPRAPAQAPAAAPNAAPAPSSPADAPATDDAASVRERARAAYTAGQDAYAAGQYAAAEGHFGRADSLLPAVQAKYWRAMSLDQLGNVPAALAAFGLVLASAEKSQLGPEKLANAEARQRALANTPAELVLSTVPAGARVNVSGVELKAPTPITLELAAGRHVVRVWLEGYEPQELELDVTAGAKLTPTLTLRPAASPRSESTPIPALPKDAAPPSAPKKSPIPGIVTLGIAGASAIVGTIFGIKALSDKSDFDDSPTTSAADDVERNALIADMAFGVTLTLGITGIVLLVADDPVPDQPQVSSLSRQRLQVAPYVAPTGAGAAATLVF